MSQLFHNAILNNVEMIKGTLEILGDPYFLVADGMGNKNVELSSQYQTTEGYAPIHQGNLFININFRNPTDINTDLTGDQGGLAIFDSNLLPFSGLYMITTLKSIFKDGIFTQELDIIRSPGQVIDNKPSIPPNDLIVSQSHEPGTQVVKDTAPVTVLKEGIRVSDLDLANLVSRGLPSIGLPGITSNFTGAITGEVNSILNQVSGVTGVFDSLINELGTSPIGGFNPLTSGISLSPSIIGSLSTPSNLSAASISAAGKSIGSLANIVNAGTNLATNVSNILPPSGSSSSLPQSVTELNGINVSGLVGDVSNIVGVTQNSITSDPSGIASKLGINPSALSGLDPSLSSMITADLSSIASSVPVNTDLGTLESQGVYFSNITGADLPNLPAVQPSVKAPLPIPDPALPSIVNANGNVSSLLNGKVNLPYLTYINNVTNPLGSITAGLNSGIGTSQPIVDQLQTMQTQIGGAINSPLGISNPVGSLSQNTINGITSAAAGQGSVESNQILVGSLAQSYSSQVASLSGITVNSKFGSLQKVSPLAQVIQSSNIEGSV
jgi:hypothetical protein